MWCHRRPEASAPEAIPQHPTGLQARGPGELIDPVIPAIWPRAGVGFIPRRLRHRGILRIDELVTHTRPVVGQPGDAQGRDHVRAQFAPQIPSSALAPDSARLRAPRREAPRLQSCSRESLSSSPQTVLRWSSPVVGDGADPIAPDESASPFATQRLHDRYARIQRPIHDHDTGTGIDPTDTCGTATVIVQLKY